MNFSNYITGPILWEVLVREALNRTVYDNVIINTTAISVKDLETVYFRCFLKTAVNAGRLGGFEKLKTVCDGFPSMDKMTSTQKYTVSMLLELCKSWAEEGKDVVNAGDDIYNWNISLNKNWKLIGFLSKMTNEKPVKILVGLNGNELNEFANGMFVCSTMKIPKLDTKIKTMLPAPKDPTKPTLLIDMDETLIHSEVVPIPDFDFTKFIDFEAAKTDIWVRIRPFCELFLKTLEPHFELIIFTAGLKGYADPIIDEIDPHEYVSHRLFRKNCIDAEGSFVKDLRYLGRDPKKTVLLDNSVMAMAFQLENLIPIFPYYQGHDDVELLEFIPFLMKMKESNDFREFLKPYYRLNEFKIKVEKIKNKSDKK